jgi:hypothetical protein
MSIQQQQHIQNLIETEAKMSLEDFFKNIHSKFYSDCDISFSRLTATALRACNIFWN